MRKAEPEKNSKLIFQRVRFFIEYLIACAAAALIFFFFADRMLAWIAGVVLTFTVSLWHVDRLNRNWLFSLFGVVPISALLLLFLPKNNEKEDGKSEEWRALVKLLITVIAFAVVSYAVAFTSENGSLF